mmetsp:Transcript_29566/g.73849  ORF Transcript_29566/g.73849 Transcript_29566/m.73849 type:complete len:281 (-) Transcript_29566:288-1130(-)
MKLELALSKPRSKNDPWVRWLVPLHLQYHRFASLQAQMQRQLTPAESRELLAARVRLRRIDNALASLLEVLRRRLDDPWFRHNIKVIRRAGEVADSFAYSAVVKAAAMEEGVNSFAGWWGRGTERRRQRARVVTLRRWGTVKTELPAVVRQGNGWWAKKHPPDKRMLHRVLRAAGRGVKSTARCVTSFTGRTLLSTIVMVPVVTAGLVVGARFKGAQRAARRDAWRGARIRNDETETIGKKTEKKPTEIIAAAEADAAGGGGEGMGTAATRAPRARRQHT